MAAAFQLSAQCLEVINAAVKNQAHLAIARKHGLAARVAQIQNRQPPMPKDRVGPTLDSLRIRTAARQRVHHGCDRPFGGLELPGRDVSRDSAHNPIIPE